MAKIAGPPNELTLDLERYNQKVVDQRELAIKREQNIATAAGLYEIVKNGLQKCNDPNDTPLFKRE